MQKVDRMTPPSNSGPPTLREEIDHILYKVENKHQSVEGGWVPIGEIKHELREALELDEKRVAQDSRRRAKELAEAWDKGWESRDEGNVDTCRVCGKEPFEGDHHKVDGAGKQIYKGDHLWDNTPPNPYALTPDPKKGS